MSQVFTACVRRTIHGFLPYVDVTDVARAMEWEELHPGGSVPDEAQARALAETLANELRRGDRVPSPGERYRGPRDADREAGRVAVADARAGASRAAMTASGLATRLNLHERLLSGDRLRGWLPEPA